MITPNVRAMVAMTTNVLGAPKGPANADSPIDRAISITTWMKRSNRHGSAREPTPAVSNSRTTASGVTMPRVASTDTSIPRAHEAQADARTAGPGDDPVVPCRELPRAADAVDIDRFIPRNPPGWDRLTELANAARKRPGALSEAELEEMIQLYQRASAQLSHARTYYRDPSLTAQLTRTVANASTVIYSSRPRTVRSLATFFATTFPAAIYLNRRFIALAAALFFIPAIVVMLWLVNSPEALDASASPEERQVYAEEQFESYYSNQPSAEFA